MKCNEEKLRKEIKNKDEELSRMQGGQVQEHPKAKQPVTQSTDTNVSIVHICIHIQVHVKVYGACAYILCFCHHTMRWCKNGCIVT